MKYSILVLIFMLTFMFSCNKENTNNIDSNNNEINIKETNIDETNNNTEVKFGNGYSKLFPELTLSFSEVKNTYFLGDILNFDIDIKNVPSDVVIISGYKSPNGRSSGLEENKGDSLKVNKNFFIDNEGLFEFFVVLAKKSDYDLYNFNIPEDKIIIKGTLNVLGKIEENEDKRFYYHDGIRVFGSDRETFEILGDGQYAKDKNFVYSYFNNLYYKIDNIKSETFKYNGGDILLDGEGAFVNYIKILPIEYNFHYDTFEYLGGNFYKDKNGVYLFDKVKKLIKKIKINNEEVIIKKIENCNSLFIIIDNKLYFNDGGYSNCANKILEEYSDIELVKIFFDKNNNIETIKFNSNFKKIN